MDLKKFTLANVQITSGAPSANARVSVSFVDTATDLQAAWAELRAELLAHPLLAGLTIATEKVDGAFSPTRGLIAVVTFKPVPPPQKPAVALVPAAPTPTKG